MNIDYSQKIANRGLIHFLLGLVPRVKQFLKHYRSRQIAIKRGATIGKHTVICRELARKANSNLIVGDHCCISGSDLDLRAPLKIGNYVILSKAVHILNASHDIHSEKFETICNPLEIEDYCWLVGCLVLPRVKLIGYGSVCGAGSVITKNVNKMAIMGGNPAGVIGIRKNVHSAYSPEVLNGGDLHIYIKTWMNAREKRSND